jgi:hypothetical protein
MRRGLAQAITIVLITHRVALGQSAPRDTMPSDSTLHHPIHTAGPYLAMLAAGPMVLAAIFAAAPLAFVFGERGPSQMALLQDHGAAYTTIGGPFSAGQSVANSAQIELFQQNVHYELLAEEFWRPVRSQYVTIRTGYLFHPRAVSAGGVTLGYVHGPEASGPEVGLPLYLGDSTSASVRVEPSYIFARRGLLWNYRVQADIPLPNRRYFAGVSAVGKADPPASRDDPNDFSHSAWMVLFGVRF